MVRQGDILLVRVEARPVTAIAEQVGGSRVVIAEGEATGHAHTIEAEAATIWSAGEEEKFLEVLRETSLLHQEHAPIALAPGTYRIVRQREYTPSEIRRVAD